MHFKRGEKFVSCLTCACHLSCPVAVSEEENVSCIADVVQKWQLIVTLMLLAAVIAIRCATKCVLLILLLLLLYLLEVYSVALFDISEFPIWVGYISGGYK